MTSHNYGHYVTVYKNNNIIYFFDSYGCKPDTQFRYAPKNLNMDSQIAYNYLTNLLYNCKYQVNYNQYKLQQKNDIKNIPVNTCGRWCCFRVMFPEISEDDFAYFFLNKKNKYKPDEMITILTEQIFNI